jgi:hypothetical protein
MIHSDSSLSDLLIFKEATRGASNEAQRNLRRIGHDKSLALSEVSRRESTGEYPDAGAETPSITRLEGSRWRGGPAMELRARFPDVGRDRVGRRGRVCGNWRSTRCVSGADAESRAGD